MISKINSFICMISKIAGFIIRTMSEFANFARELSSDGMLWAIVDYKELVSRKSSFVNCSEGKPYVLTALLLLLDLFAACLLNRWSMNEWKSESVMRLLLFYYSFINFSRRAKTNFIGTISHLCIGLFHATCWLNTEMTSYMLVNQMLDATVKCSCVRFECMLLCFLQRVPIEWWLNESFV